MFALLNSSLGWIETAADPFCSFYARYIQQKPPLAKISHLIEQNNIVRKLKKIGTKISYARPTDVNDYDLSILVFSDASRVCQNGQICVITGLLVGEMKQDAIFHVPSWLSHKTNLPVKTVPAAEIMAATEGIDEGNMIA